MMAVSNSLTPDIVLIITNLSISVNMCLTEGYNENLCSRSRFYFKMRVSILLFVLPILFIPDTNNWYYV